MVFTCSNQAGQSGVGRAAGAIVVPGSGPPGCTVFIAFHEKPEPSACRETHSVSKAYCRCNDPDVIWIYRERLS